MGRRGPPSSSDHTSSSSVLQSRSSTLPSPVPGSAAAGSSWLPCGQRGRLTRKQSFQGALPIYKGDFDQPWAGTVQQAGQPLHIQRNQLVLACQVVQANCTLIKAKRRFSSLRCSRCETELLKTLHPSRKRHKFKQLATRLAA
jgi:hypothetical protein